MARNGWCVLCVWLVTASLLTAAEPTGPGVPPQFAIVTKLDVEAGEVEVQLVVMKPVTEADERVVTNPSTGEAGAEFIARTTKVSEIRARRIKLSEVRLITAAQKAVDPSDVSKRLKPDAAVLIQESNRSLDKRYLATLKDETLILVVKPEPPLITPLLPGPLDPVLPLCR